MTKTIVSILFTAFLFSCNQKESNNTSELEAQIKSLEDKLAETYKPGFGDLMGNIQTHHAKLWFAGTNENWKLAEFEIHEILEALSDIQKFNADRPETSSLPIINPAMERIVNSISQKNLSEFKNSFNLLTNSCNSCHQATKHEFNVITIPTEPPLSNQNFKPAQ